MPVGLTAIHRTGQMKPGYKTTEFWLTIAVNVGAALLISGALPVEGPATQVIAALVSGLTNAGYGVSRGLAKRG